MRDAVIVEVVRTPVGERNSGLSAVRPVDLSAHVLKALVGRSGVDDVIWGCVHKPHSRQQPRGFTGHFHLYEKGFHAEMLQPSTVPR
jgi:acetyl-CoA acetyltransferase